MNWTLNTAAALLHFLPLHDGLRARLWGAISRSHAGEPYLYRTRLFNRDLIYGGVCGTSDDALLQPLEQYESDTWSVARRLLRKRRRPVVIDVGAHNGEWIALVKSAAREADIHAYEPFPQLAAFIETLVDVNEWRGVTLHRAVAGERAGFARLHFAPGATTTASTVPQFQPTFSESLACPCETLDDALDAKAAERLAFIKIDVEGGELEVLQGALRLLDERHPPLLLELLAPQHAEHRERQAEVLKLLSSRGYRFFQIQTGGRLAGQDPVVPDPSYRFVNYLATVDEAPR